MKRSRSALTAAVTLVGVAALAGAIASTANVARAEGLLPGGVVHTFRCREDTLITTTLTFDPAPSDIQVGVVDTSFTLVGVVRAVWTGGPDDGLEWYFSDSDSQSVSNNEILFHGFFRPGMGGVFFPAEIDGLPTESNPQVWVPAGTDLAEGYTWSWTGRWPFDDYVEVHTLNFEAARETIDVPYRDAASTWKLSQPAPPAALIRARDGTLLDAMGRIVASDGAKLCAAADPTEPRWHALINSGRKRWCILFQDAFYELVELEDTEGGAIVPVSTKSFSDLKRHFGL